MYNSFFFILKKYFWHRKLGKSNDYDNITKVQMFRQHRIKLSKVKNEITIENKIWGS